MNPAPTPAQVPLLDLSPAQMAQQIDLARRMLHMASIGTPRIESADPLAPQLLVLHALITAYQAVANATPAIAQTAAFLALDAGCNLKDTAERYAATTH